MRPYGAKLNFWKDEDGGPTSKYQKLSSTTRKRLRRLMHRNARRQAKSQVQTEGSV